MKHIKCFKTQKKEMLFSINKHGNPCVLKEFRITKLVRIFHKIPNRK